jgi:DNA polymerase III subunit delta
MISLFFGDDDYSLRRALDGLRRALGDAASADLNTTVLDGRSLALDELRVPCDTMPFLAETRLVIVEGLPARFEPRPAGGETAKGRPDPLEAGLCAYLPLVPPSAHLVFVERGSVSERNPILRALRECKAEVREFAPPKDAALTAWIQKQVSAAGGRISPRAAETLAAFVGGNLRQLSQEIDKLTTYAGQRTIEEGDVQRLVADAREIKVWTLTDALASHNRDQAIGVLQRLLEDGEQPPVLMAIVARQLRTLIQVKELGDEHLSADAIAGQMKMHPYTAQKAIASARRMSYQQIEANYRRLLQADLEVKTGRLEPGLALELLVIDVTTA